MTQAQKIRDALKTKGVLVMPGVYDCLSAKIASRAGFEVIFITGYSVSATYLGEPDFGLLTQTELLSASQRICSVTPLPVIVDADTGYGNAVNVIRTVREYIQTGVAAIHLEDQVIPLEEYLHKLHAAIDARGKDDFYIVARTDARQALGLEEAIRRGQAFKDAGADAVFIEAPNTKEEMREIGRNVPGPLVANMIERGVTPLMGPEELKDLGFQLIVWPLGPLYASARALENVYSTLRRNGTTHEIMDRLISFEDFHDIIGLKEKYALDEKYKS